jgi:trk system potassium uptake protein TrkH
MILLILMVIGGCSGSTGGGVKVVRIVIATRTALRSIVQSFRPNITKPMRMGGKVISESATQSVIVFLMLVILIEIVSMIFVSAVEPSLSFMEIFSCVQTTLFNVGPGFKSIGPAENFHFLSSTTKIFLSLLMILGRLELYAVLVLFSPTVWKQYS